MKYNVINDSIPRLYFHYLIPTLIATFSNSLYCLADVFFIAKGSGSIGIAALNIALPLFSMYSAIGLTFGVGAATIMSITEGNHRFDERNKAFTIGIVGMTIVGLFIMIAGNIYLEPLCYMLGSNDTLLPYVKEYVLPINTCAVFFTINYASSILLRNDHAPKFAMTIMIIGNFSNIFLDYLFVIVFGKGLYGAAVATALSAVISTVAVIPYFLFKKNTVFFTKNICDIYMWKRIILNGFGSGILELSVGIVIFAFNYVIVKEADEIFLAAYAIIANIAFVTKGLCNGFAQAAQPIISINYGARKKTRMKKAFHLSIFVSGVAAIVGYSIFLLYPEKIVSIFSNYDISLLPTATKGIKLYFSSLILTAVVTMILYYFQAIECSRAATILAILKGVVFVLISLFILVKIFGVNGIWLTITVAEFLSLLCGIGLYRRIEKEQ